MKEALDFQKYLQNKAYETDLDGMSDAQRIAYIRTMVLALEDELHEALAETSWKPWATTVHFNKEPYLDELADAYIFLMNLILAAGQDTAEDFLERVKSKQLRNHKRQQDDGYDGVLEKCSNCRRELDKPDAIAVEKLTSALETTIIFSCTACRTHLSRAQIEKIQKYFPKWFAHLRDTV